MYGALNWFDVSAAACGEMVFDLVDALGVPLTPEIATHVYVAILTDTGSFHYSNITPRTFEICRRCVEAGVNPPAIARSIFDSNNLGPAEAVRRRPQPAWSSTPTGRIATDLGRPSSWRSECGGTYDDTEGLINLPLTVKEIVAVVFFKENGAGRLARQPALEGRRRRQRRRQGSSAAAATRTPPAAACRARSPS